MKKYPKALADLEILRDCVEYLYRQAETEEDTAATYAEDLKNNPDDPWYLSQVSEHQAKAAAYVRLAEKISK